ncbi:MAG: lipopolysaccharide kinase InaA family protein [Deltaproteobacteria bacterium]|nr:lipopolysaccharide kinase InaA family protein [Deltaproteobacteria bacterium]
MALTQLHRNGYKLFTDKDHGKIVDWFLENQEDENKLPSPFHTSRYSIVWKIENFEGNAYFIKRFRPESFPVRLKDSLRGSRALRSLKAGEMLEKRDFSVPRIIAMGERRSLGLLSDSFMITLPIEGISLLELLLPVRDFKIKRSVIRRVGHEIGRLHREGIIHGDLIPGNIFAMGKNDNIKLCLLDNERTRKVNKLPHNERIKNLVQFNRVIVPRVTASDRVRFFDAYLEENRDLESVRKKLLRKIGEITSERVMRHRGISAEKRKFTTFRAVMAWKE